MNHFYNRTWNERSLSKYANNAGSHNYENVYSGEQETSVDVPPDYENFPPLSSDESFVINKLTCSPRSAASQRLSILSDSYDPYFYPSQMSRSQTSGAIAAAAVPVAPARKCRNQNKASKDSDKHLTDLRVGERPKMREARQGHI